MMNLISCYQFFVSVLLGYIKDPFVLDYRGKSVFLNGSVVNGTWRLTVHIMTHELNAGLKRGCRVKLWGSLERNESTSISLPLCNLRIPNDRYVLRALMERV